jgi:hypothetical protein
VTDIDAPHSRTRSGDAADPGGSEEGEPEQHQRTHTTGTPGVPEEVRLAGPPRVALPALTATRKGRRLTLESRHLPDEPAMGERAAEPELAEHGEHRRRRMGERPELLAQQLEDEALGGDEQARDRVSRG